MPAAGSVEDFGWIDEMTDAECAEVFWIYVDPPELFLSRHPRALLGAALRRALHEIARTGRERDAR